MKTLAGFAAGLLVAMAPGIHLEFANVASLLFVLVCFLGMVLWVTYIAFTQRKLLKTMVTRAELKQAFENFRKELQAKDEC